MKSTKNGQKRSDMTEYGLKRLKNTFSEVKTEHQEIDWKRSETTKNGLIWAENVKKQTQQAHVGIETPLLNGKIRLLSLLKLNTEYGDILFAASMSKNTFSEVETEMNISNSKFPLLSCSFKSSISKGEMDARSHDNNYKILYS